MTSLNQRPRFMMMLSVLIAAGTVVGIAASDSPHALWRTFTRMEPSWLAPAIGFELLAYVGYVLAYRATIPSSKRSRLSLMLTIRLVVAGFGPFVPLGGFSFDRRALRAVHRSRRDARRQVLALGVIEYALLAPAACICALILLLESGKASLVLTLPWVFAVPPGFALGWWASEPRHVKRFQEADGRVRRWIGEMLGALGVLRELVLRPLERPGALLGMGIYWAADIACFAFALRCFEVSISVPALVVAYATGYAASRRSLPLGGAGVTEALLTLALIEVHVGAVAALLSVAAYRVVNFLVPVIPGLIAHSSLAEVMDGNASGSSSNAA